MIHVIGGAESNSSPGGKSVKLSRVVTFDAVAASTWLEGSNPTFGGKHFTFSRVVLFDAVTASTW